MFAHVALSFFLFLTFSHTFLYFIFSSWFLLPSKPSVGETSITEVFIRSFLFPTSFHFSFAILSLFTEFNFSIMNWVLFHSILLLLLLFFQLFGHSYNHSVEWFITMWWTFSRHVLLVFHVCFISALGLVWIWSSLLVRCFSFSWNHCSFSLVIHSIQERWDFYWQLQVLALVFWVCYLPKQTPYPRVKACLFLILSSTVFWCLSISSCFISSKLWSAQSWQE